MRGFFLRHHSAVTAEFVDKFFAEVRACAFCTLHFLSHRLSGYLLAALWLVVAMVCGVFMVHLSVWRQN
jgi:hypothetical protein